MIWLIDFVVEKAFNSFLIAKVDKASFHEYKCKTYIIYK